MLPIHKESLVIDCLNAIFPRNFNENYVSHLREGGIDVVHITIPDVESFSTDYVKSELTRLFVNIRKLKHLGVTLATSAREIRHAKKDNGISVLLGTQGSGFLGLELDSLEFYWRVGLRILQPTYQQRNQFGSGCGEKTDEGLSELGHEWVERMNELRMLISLSHAGRKTSLDAIKISKDPVIFSHSNAKSISNHVRNIDDEQIKACAEKGGVIGLTPVAMFLSSQKDPGQLTVSDYIAHIDYISDLVGIDHVGLGMDLAEEYFYRREDILQKRSQLPSLTSTFLLKKEDEFLASGRDKLPFAELYMPPWIQQMSDLPVVSDALSRSGYSDLDIKKILGENFLRVFERVVGA
jgi:membrane dipeptidase